MFFVDCAIREGEAHHDGVAGLPRDGRDMQMPAKL